MARLRKPLSAIDRLVFLKTCVETSKKDQEREISFLSESILTRATGFIGKLEVGLGSKGKWEGLAQQEIREKNEALSELKTYVRDLWAVLGRRVYREHMPLEVFAYYQLPKNGNNPVLTTEGQWVETAKLIIQGEADAIAAGYAAMTNPGVDELQEKLDAAIAEMEDIPEADRKLDEAQEAVSDLMPEAKQIIDRIIAELQFNLYDKDDASKRRIMRTYGVRFQLTKNEELEDQTDLLVN